MVVFVGKGVRVKRGASVFVGVGELVGELVRDGRGVLVEIRVRVGVGVGVGVREARNVLVGIRVAEGRRVGVLVGVRVRVAV